jgi:ribosomal protein L31E
MNYVGEKPVDRLHVRVARFTADGVTRVDVPVNGRR